MDEWINEVWYTHIMENYSALKSNEALTQTITWMNPENVLSEKNQTQKAMYYLISFISNF